MTRATRSLIHAFAQALLFLALPFAVLPWLMPFVSPLTIGADRPVFTIQHQLALQLSLRNGSFPLFVPGFALGQSSAAATLGQLFHPISHLAAHVPGYWSGGALEIETALDLLSLGVAQLVLFRVFRALEARTATAFLVSFLAVYNLRMLDLFRYGAALQNGVGYLLLCAALLHLATRGPSLARAAGVAGATYLMLCGGHPQMAYLGGLGAVPIAILAPFFADACTARSSTGAGATRRRARCIAVGCAGIGTGILLAAAYLTPLYFDFVRESAVRAHREFRWVYWPHGTASVWSLLDSAFRPLHADVHGSFAGSALLVVPLVMPLLAVLRPLPRVVWALWLLVVLTLAIALAPALPLYRVLWSYLPGFSAFRVPGRVTMMLTVPLALLLLWTMERSGETTRFDGRTRRSAAALLAMASLALYALYWLARGSRLDPGEVAPPLVIRDIPPAIRLAVPALGAAALAALAWFATRPTRRATVVLVLCAVAQQALVLGFSTWVQRKEPTATYDELMARQRIAPGFVGSAGVGMEPMVVSEYVRRMKRPMAAGPLAHLERRFTTVASLDDAYDFLRHRDAFVGPEAPRAVIESAAPVAQKELQPSRRGTGRVKLEHASFNRLVLRVVSPAPALLEVRYPFTTRWHALLDGRASRVARANGVWLGVVVPEGTRVVELRYVSPAALAGMLVSLATAWALAVALIVSARGGERHADWRRGLGIAGATCAAVMAFVLWWQSLYGGAHLGTSYSWPQSAGVAPGIARGSARP